ncbi:MAG TPA: SDR family oxidoreductase [Anaerolineales bacterium]
MATYNHSYQGRLALITGGSSGIGLALAQLLAREGTNVWLLARHKDTLETALKSLPTQGDQRHGIAVADVSNWEQLHTTVQRITREAGLPDLLINSAGITEPGYVQDIPAETFREIMDINYLGTVHTTKAVLPGMLERGSGHIINISSAGGFITGPGYAAYSPSKFAVRGFSDALRAEVKPRGLRVSLVYPPNTDTPQRAYEVSRQSPEVHNVDENAGLGPWKFGTLPVSQVAEEILQGVKRERYVILPGSGNRVLYRLISLLGDFAYNIVDDEWNAARRKAGKG